MNAYDFFFVFAASRTSSTILNKSAESRHPYFIFDLRGRALFFTIEYDVSCVFFFICGLYYVEVCSPKLTLLTVYIMNECCTLSNAFSASIEKSYGLNPFSYLCDVSCWLMWKYWTTLPFLEYKSHLIMVNDFIMCCWIQFAIFLKIFVSMFMRDTGL